MNNPHKGARLTVYSREQIVARIQAGTKSAEVAAAFGVGSGQNMGVMRGVFCLRRSADHRELRPL